VAQRVGRGIALLFHDRSTRRDEHFTPGKDPVPVLQEAGWAPGPVWTGGKTPFLYPINILCKVHNQGGYTCYNKQQGRTTFE